MNVLIHFDETNTGTYTLYKLKKGQWKNLLGKFPVKFRQCYITDAALDELSKKIGVTKSQYLEKYILPDKANIVSGDFGEILSYWAIKDKYQSKGIQLNGPKKWRYKFDRNKAVMGADALLFHKANPRKPSKDDVLVSIESKMKAVVSTDHRIQKAIDGAEQDKNTRMAKTLIWLEELYAKNGDRDSVSFIKRFNDPATHGNFTKEFNAIAILDSTLEAGETGQVFTNKQNVTVIVFSVDDLKRAYESTRDNIIKSI